MGLGRIDVGALLNISKAVSVSKALMNNNQVMDTIIDTVSAYDYYEIPSYISKNGLTFKG